MAKQQPHAMLAEAFSQVTRESGFVVTCVLVT